MLMDYVPWLFGSAPYVLLLALGISYCVLRAPRNPHVYRWTLTALSMALVAWVFRPVLTQWPWLLTEQFPHGLVYHSFAAAVLDIAPLGLLIQALRPRPGDPVRPASEAGPETTARNGPWLVPRWGWLMIGGVLFLILFQTTASLAFAGKLTQLLLALAGAGPCLLLVWWMRIHMLRPHGDVFSLRVTYWALVAWLVAWIVRPVLLASPLSIDHDHPLSAFLSSLCTGIPIGLLALVVLVAESSVAAREAPARQAPSSAGQLLWLCLGGIVGAIISAVLFVIGLSIYLATSSGGGGHGAWPGPGTDALFIGTPAGLLLGFLLGGVVAALKLRNRLSLRKCFLIGMALYLAVLGGLCAWNQWSSPTRAAVANFPVEQQPVIALLYELRAVQPSHMKAQPLFARDIAEIQADLDEYGTAAVPALITALDDWQIHHFAAGQLGRLRDPRAIPPLVDFLVHPRGLNPYFVNEALKQFDDDDVAAALAEMDGQSDLVERAPGQADDPVDAGANPGAVETLIATLKQQDEFCYSGRFEAIRALATLGDPRAVDALYALLEDETAREQDLQRQQRAEGALLRPAAAAALGHFKDPRIFETLTRLVETDENLEVRAGAARGLGTLGDRQAIPLLQRAVAGEIPYESPMSLVIDLDWYAVELAARDALRALRSQ